MVATLCREVSTLLAKPPVLGGLGSRGAHCAQLPLEGWFTPAPPGAPQSQRWAHFHHPHCCTTPPAPPSPSQMPLPRASPAPEPGKPFAGTAWLSSAALASEAPPHPPGQAAHEPLRCRPGHSANAPGAAGKPRGAPTWGTGSSTRELLPEGAGARSSGEGGTREPKGAEMATVLAQLALAKLAAGAATGVSAPHAPPGPCTDPC